MTLIWHGCYRDQWGSILAPAAFAHPAKVAPGPLPDDEQLVTEAEAAEFIPVAAGLLETDETTVKARLKALGYTAIPGKPAERVAAYRRLKNNLGTDEQDALFDDQPEPVGDGAYTE